jgi:hypothetical protein
LSDLSEGEHEFEVDVSATSYYNQIPAPDNHIVVAKVKSETRSLARFTVDTEAPIVSAVALTNSTGDSRAMLLSFRVNEATSGFTISLDNQANVTIQGNTTLTNLSAGAHNVTIYANDTARNTAKSEMIFFEVNSQTYVIPEPSSSPTVFTQGDSTPTTTSFVSTRPPDNTRMFIFFVIIAAAVIAVVAAAIYIKKHHKPRG